MTVTRIGSNSKYAAGWEQAFGGQGTAAKSSKSGDRKKEGAAAKSKGDKPKDKKGKK